jgi:hypothetical protein
VDDALVFKLTHYFDQGRPVVELIQPVTIAGVLIPAGFKTDFASIPAPLVWIFPVFGRSCRAALLHDLLCTLGADRASRSIAFLRQMLTDNVPQWQAYAQYLAVRWWPGPEIARYS